MKNILKINKKLIISIVAVILVIVSSAVVYKVVINAKNKAASQQKAVMAAKAKARAKADAVVIVTGSGNIKSSNSFDIIPSISGKVKKVYFKEGDKVKTNDLMFEIDSSEIESNINKLTNDIDEAKSELNNDLSQINKLTFTAPFSGQVSNILVKTGDIVTKGTSILTLADRSKVKLTVPFNGAQIKNITPGLTATVYIQETCQTVQGTVSYVNTQPRSGDTDGVLFNVEILIDNPGGLKEAQKATAEINGGGESMTSPKSGSFVYANSKVLQSECDGKVQNIDLKEDQCVNSGDTLMTLENDEITNSKDAANLKIKDNQTQLDYSQKQLGDYKIYAPMDGTISKQQIKEGQLLKTGDTISSLVDLDHIELVVSIDDTDIRYIALGQKASVKVDALSETSTKPIEGVVTKIPVAGDTVNGNTTYQVTISLPKTPDLKIGMNANIEIKVNKK